MLLDLTPLTWAHAGMHEAPFSPVSEARCRDDVLLLTTGLHLQRMLCMAKAQALSCGTSWPLGGLLFACIAHCLTLYQCLLQDSAMDIFQVQSKLDVEHKLPVTGARNGTYMHRWGCLRQAAARASGYSTTA